MSRKHYISFVAFLSGDTAVLKKLYPEWGLAVRLPFLPTEGCFGIAPSTGFFLRRYNP